MTRFRIIAILTFINITPSWEDKLTISKAEILESYIISQDLLEVQKNTSHYLEHSKAPPGCTCLDKSNTKSITGCNVFDCMCDCDLTAGKCDPNCCCDRECLDEEINRFDDAGRCQSTWKMIAPLAKTTCNEEKADLEDLNPSYPTRVRDTPQHAFHSFLCIEIDNSAVKGNFLYHDFFPFTNFHESEFSREGRDTFGSYQDIDSILTSSNHFLPGDLIPVFRVGVGNNNYSHDVDALTEFQEQTNDYRTTNYMKSFSGVLAVPFAGDSGLCNDKHPIYFSTDHTSSCYIIIDDIPNACIKAGGYLDSGRYVSGLFVGSTPNTIPSFGLHPKDDPSLIGIKYTSKIESVDHTYEGSDILLESKWKEDEAICEHAFKKIEYIITYDPMIGAIIDIEALITTTNITKSERIIEQEFTINFLSISMVDKSFRNDGVGYRNNRVKRKKSGNPGYYFGYPTLAGMASNKSSTGASVEKHIKSQVAGLVISGSRTGGNCIKDSTIMKTIGFGEDVMSGCTLSLTRQELADLCTMSSHPYLVSSKIGDQTVLIPQWLLSDQNFVGKFGNADPLDMAQWLEIKSSGTQTLNLIWQSSHNRCYGLVSNLQYNFLWTHVGSANNPQAMILSCERKYQNDIALMHIIPPKQKQNFQFTTIVTWTYVRPKNMVIKPSPPSILLSLPNDIFYPFQSQSCSIGVKFDVLILLLVICLLFIPCLS